MKINIFLIKAYIVLCLILFSSFSIANQVLTSTVMSGIWKAQVAIIIDDIGYRKSDIDALYLPGPFSYAILPQTPFGKSFALKAHKEKKDIILHIPMEAKNNKKLGPNALMSSMNEAKIRAQLSNAFAEIPFAVGMNNHMGSKLTELYLPMAWTMKFLKERNLFFVDSMTTVNSQAGKVAKRFGVVYIRRHVFLDNQLDQGYIRNQFKKIIDKALKYKKVVAIAHPHPETMNALQKLLPLLKKHHIALVPISHLLKR